MSKYIPKSTRKSDSNQGRRPNPDTWKTGPDPIKREKYYAFLKHRSQAQYRKEQYDLTWEQWQALWINGSWDQRGKTSDSLCLARLNNQGAWCWSNVRVMTRAEQLKIPRTRKSQE